MLTQEQLYILNHNVSNNLETIIDYFGLKLNERNEKYVGCCPVHGGDNPMAFNLHKPDSDKGGYWRCFTHHCEKRFIDNFIGLIRGLLSRDRYGWCGPSDRMATMEETVEFIQQFIKCETSISIDIDKARFKSLVKRHNKSPKESKKYAARETIVSSLQIPAPYYLNRGYSPEILTKYDIGLCQSKNKPMSNRIVVPIYDNEHKFMIGCTGRSIYEQCHKCKTWHDISRKCPDIPNGFNAKWLHHGFTKTDILYNYWFAANYIRNTKTAIIVESPGNVWRLEEAGIHNGVAILGTSISPQQIYLLDQLGVMSLLVIFDNDQNRAGQEAFDTIKKEYNRIYNIYSYFPKQTNDLGEMSSKSIQQEIIPILDKIIFKEDSL